MKKLKLICVPMLVGSLVVALSSCNNEVGTGSIGTILDVSTATVATNSTLPATSQSTTVTKESMKKLELNVKYPTGKAFYGAKVRVYASDESGISEILTTDSKGYASGEFLTSHNYYCEVLNVPEEYSFNPFSAVFDDNNRNQDINLVDLSVASGKGTTAKPYELASGYYSNTLNKDQEKYYCLKFSKSGTYELESFSVANNVSLKLYNSSSFDSFLGVFNNGGNNNNFKYEFVVTAEMVSSNKYLYFSLNSSDEENLLFSVKQTEEGNKVGKKVGNICPSTDLKTTLKDGTLGTYNLAKDKTKITIVNFWATWCGFCVKEMPDFDKIMNEYDGVSVVAIHDGGTFSSVKSEYFSKYINGDWSEYNFTWAYDNEAQTYYNSLGGTGALPMTIVVNGDGIIIGRFEEMTTYAQLKAIIDVELSK